MMIFNKVKIDKIKSGKFDKSHHIAYMNPKNLSLPTFSSIYTQKTLQQRKRRREEKEENFHIDFISKLSHMSYFTNLLPSTDDPEMWKGKVFLSL